MAAFALRRYRRIAITGAQLLDPHSISMIIDAMSARAPWADPDL